MGDGTGSRYRNSRQTSYRRSLSPGQRIAERVLDEMDVHAPALQLRRAIAAGCEAAGVDPPSMRSITARIARRRLDADEPPGTPRLLVVDHCALELPIRLLGADGRSATALPIATLAIVEPGGALAAAALGIGLPGVASTAGVLVDAVSAMRGDRLVATRIRCRGSGDWSALLAAFDGSASVPPAAALAGSTGSDAMRLIGRSLSGLRLRPRSPGRCAVPEGFEADREHLPAVVRRFDAAVTRHNARRSQVDGLRLAREAGRDRLLRALQRLRDQPDPTTFDGDG